MRRLLPLLFAVVWAQAAHAQTTQDITLPGQAQTGTDRRDVRFVFSCTANGEGSVGALELALAVPHAEDLLKAFDFNVFEGPDARAGKLTRVETAGKTAGPFQVSGWYGVEADAPFYFGLSAALRDDAAALAAVARALRPLTAGQSTLVWRQGNPTKGGSPLTATLSVSDYSAKALKTLLAPCLATARP